MSPKIVWEDGEYDSVPRVVPDDKDIIKDHKAQLAAKDKQIATLEEEADWTDIFDALQRAGIDMGNAGEGQDPITAIEILAKQRDDARARIAELEADIAALKVAHQIIYDELQGWKAKATEERAARNYYERDAAYLWHVHVMKSHKDEFIKGASRELEEEMKALPSDNQFNGPLRTTILDNGEEMIEYDGKYIYIKQKNGIEKRLSLDLSFVGKLEYEP